MRIFILNFTLFLFLSLSVSFNCFGTHLRAGEIQVRRTSCNALTFEISLIIYVNTIGTSVTVGGENDVLSFGDGETILVPSTAATQVIDAQLGISKTVVKLLHTFSKPGRYVISYVEQNRNGGVLNMSSSGTMAFQIETMILIEDGKCNSYPTLLSAPIDRACRSTAFFHNPAGFDTDHDSLSYELAIPKKDNTSPVAQYLLPNDATFYSLAGIPYNNANEAKSGAPVFQIDPISGLLKWDAPGAQGEYAIAIKIREWKKNTAGNWYESSYTIRDMQIVVSECENTRPTLTAPDEICVVAGESLNFNVLAEDADGDSVRVDFFSELLEVGTNQPVISPASSVSNLKASPLNLNFNMPTSCVRVRVAPYTVTVKVTDRRKNVSPLSQYKTINIHVIAPPPKLESATVNPILKHVSLQWSMPSCEQIQSFQIWRRTSSIAYTESQCSKGMPEFLRYDLLAVVPQSQTTFIDGNLEIGSQYCYRIVGIVSGVPGKLSFDTCLIPKAAEAPVITNVSVEETQPSTGKILVKWTPPFEIDKTQYPPPYRYRVIRKNETLNTAFERVSDQLSDTTFTNVSLNTNDYVYRYFIELYVNSLTNLPIDSSSQASSIVATSDSKVEQIDLHWSAKTPWSNYSEKNPYHLIFRSISKDGPFELIDSINVITHGFLYADRGRYDNKGLSRDPYFYKIKTRGTYGNPSVKDPLENFSPAIFGQLLDTIPPCAPIAQIESIACNQYSCDGKSYYTLLKWLSEDQPCNEDIIGYEVLAKSDSAQQYTSLGVVTQNSFRHGNLSNLDYCYRIVAIDHVGNRSDSSAVVCNSSCLNFKLPNVITPGNDGQNDFLTVFDEENSTVDDCARSVSRVELQVYSRWGEEIFVKEIKNHETNIYWPGTTTTGIDVSAGTYFYKAQVDFQTNDKTRQRQQFKGWVHVLR